jgi:hypothetical protein
MRGGNRGRALALAALAALALAGCGVEESSMPANLPPLTYLAIAGDTLNVTPYRTILHWWGTDMDGRVIGYAFRWDGPWTPAPGESLWWEDPTWVFTTATIDTFDVPIGGSYAERTFSVRAIDDQKTADPVPRRQRFRLSNFPPVVSWTDSTRFPTLARPSLPAVSFSWKPEDYDGRRTVAYARLWLDTRPGEDSAAAAVTVVDDTLGAFFPENFQGRYGERTAHLQIFDRAATGSNVLTWRWTVVPPGGEYLLIDNAGGQSTGPQRTDDQFWRARMDAFAPGNYHVIDVAVDGVFRSRAEVLPIFSLFKGVVWYGGVSFDGGEASDAAMVEGLRLAQESLEPYAAAGGRILITGHNLLGTNGALTPAFYRDRFGIEALYTHVVEDERPTDFLVPRNLAVRCGPAFGGVDRLLVNSPLKNTDFFRPSASLEPLLWFDPATLDTTAFPEHKTEPFYFGAIARSGNGRIALATTVLTRFRAGDAGTPDEGVNALLESLFDAP